MGWAFQVIAHVDGMACRLDLPACMHWVYGILHISLIKQYMTGGHTQPTPKLVEEYPEWKGEQILDHRTVKRGSQHKLEYQGSL